MRPSTLQLSQIGNIPAIEVNNDFAQAVILLQGAQVIHYQPHGQAALLWQNPQAEFVRGQAVRTGIPICWPWFGDLSRNPTPVQACFENEQASAHGYARTQLWSIHDWVSNTDGTIINFQLGQHSNQLPSLLAELSIHIGQSLSLSLTTTNKAPSAITFSQAFHSYFPTENINKTQINGLDGCDYLDAADAWQEKKQSGPVLFQAETDRIYLNSPNKLSINTTMDNKVQPNNINIQTSGSASTVIWNPWQDKAKRLSQFNEQAYKNMFCVETANANSDAITLHSEQSHLLKVKMKYL